MSKFKVGDRVRCLAAYDGNDAIVGKCGRVASVYVNRRRLAVDFDEAIQYGHACDGSCRDGHGWNLPESNLELVTNTSAVIDAATAYREALARHQETAAEVEAARERLLTLAGAAA